MLCRGAVWVHVPASDELLTCHILRQPPRHVRVRDTAASARRHAPALSDHSPPVACAAPRRADATAVRGSLAGLRVPGRGSYLPAKRHETQPQEINFANHKFNSTTFPNI